MYAGRVACCPLVTHFEYADGTDRQTEGRHADRYTMLSAERGQPSVISIAKTRFYIVGQLCVQEKLKPMH